MDDWNAILNQKLDKDGRRTRGSDKSESSLIDLLAEHDLVDRFRLDHPVREMWMWLIDSPPGQIWTYMDMVLEEPIVISLRVPRSTG